MKKTQARISVARQGKVLGEFALLQLPSLVETGYLLTTDKCLDQESGEWVPLSECLKLVPGYSRRPGAAPKQSPASVSEPAGSLLPYLLALAGLALAIGAGLYSWTLQQEVTDLKARLAATERRNAEETEKYQRVLFAGREVAAENLVRGRVILRDAAGKRAALPGVKVRLYPRKAIETWLQERHAEITASGESDPQNLAQLHLKSAPVPIETTSTDSDGRYELKVPEPGEYVVQTSIRSAKSKELKLWFVSFDSRDPLNTPVDITESNSVQQYNPLLMVVEGR